jgi:hypothetical protein
MPLLPRATSNGYTGRVPKGIHAGLTDTRRTCALAGCEQTYIAQKATHAYHSTTCRVKAWQRRNAARILANARHHPT